MHFNDYQPNSQCYDELFDADGKARDCAKVLIERINQLAKGEIQRRQQAAELALLNMGITFTLASDQQGTERIFPFDVVPRIIDAKTWQAIDTGLQQRIRALNLFLQDIYNEQRILKDKVIPREIIESAATFRKECVGLKPPKDIWCHITGTDLIRGADGVYYVLEDNLRCPSGVSYVLENRQIMKRIFPSVFEASHVRPVVDYAEQLACTMQAVAPEGVTDPSMVVLTPGIHNSAYFEHAYLAQQMGIQLVQGGDLVVENKHVYKRMTDGFHPVHVIYRRIDDVFLDPKTFRKDSLIGVPGLMEAYQAGNVTLMNAPGTGVADDKVVYKFVPDMIKYYLGEEALLPNVPTYLCTDDKEREYVLKNLETLVVKSANEAGGYGMLIGPASTAKERKEFAQKIKDNPRNFMAQPVVQLSQVPTLIGNRFEGRHVDLRPYILNRGSEVFVLPGGLTRVALKRGSLVVNSSQGGGSKDTWVLEESAC